MSTEQFANNAQTSLNGAITATATTLTVASASGFPSSAQFRILIDSELMIVTAGAGTTTWTVTRGAEGTTTAAHANQATVSQVLTVGGLENLDASYIGTGELALARGGSGADLSGTGGTGQYVKQTSAGASLSVGTIPATDLPNLDASKITTGTLPITRGGTNSNSSLNDNRIMESSGGAIVEGPALTNGQLLIGNTGNAPSAGTLTPGTGIAITNGAGSITVSGSAFAASGSSHSAGDVPDPGSTGGTTRYLREDATWDVPPGSGGTALMLSTYNIKAKNNGTSPNTKIDISPGPFDPTGMFEAILEDNSSPPNTYKARQSSTITIDSGVTGANGLDTGSLAASTWYYFYLIYNGSTVAGLLSASATSPTMPKQVRKSFLNPLPPLGSVLLEAPHEQAPPDSL